MHRLTAGYPTLQAIQYNMAIIIIIVRQNQTFFSLFHFGPDAHANKYVRYFPHTLMHMAKLPCFKSWPALATLLQTPPLFQTCSQLTLPPSTANPHRPWPSKHMRERPNATRWRKVRLEESGKRVDKWDKRRSRGSNDGAEATSSVRAIFVHTLPNLS